MILREEWVSPSARSRFVVVERSLERLRLEFTDDPGDIGPPEHLHPRQDEEFAVLEGTLMLKVGGVEHRLEPGRRLVVRKGEAHTFWNPSETEPVRFTSEHRPALGFESFLKTIYDLDCDGLSDRKGQPRLLQIMTILRARGGEEFLAGPPRIAQIVAAAVLGTLGALVGYKPIYVSRERSVT